MAVDSAAKRFSMMELGAGVGLVLIPDGAIGAQDRSDLLDLYVGLSLSNPATILVDARLIDMDTGYRLVDTDTGYTLVEVDETRYVLKKVN